MLGSPPLPMLPRLLALLVAVGLIAGCGGGPELANSGTNVDAVLRDTLDNLGQMKSASIDARLTVDAESHVTARLTGAYVSQDGRLPKFHLAGKVDEGGERYTASATWTGEKGYVGLQGVDYEVADLLARQVAAGYEQALAAKGRIDLTRWLRDPRQTAAGDTIKITGDADVARVIDDVERLSRALSLPGAGEKLTPADRSRAIAAAKRVSVAIYTGAADHVLRRLTVAGATRDARFTLDLSLARVGEDQKIPEPEHARPFSELLKALDHS